MHFVFRKMERKRNESECLFSVLFCTFSDVNKIFHFLMQTIRVLSPKCLDWYSKVLLFVRIMFTYLRNTVNVVNCTISVPYCTLRGVDEQFVRSLVHRAYGTLIYMFSTWTEHDLHAQRTIVLVVIGTQFVSSRHLAKGVTVARC